MKKHTATTRWLAVATLCLPQAANACVVCNQGGLQVLPIVLPFLGFGMLGLGCLLYYSLLYTNRKNVEQPASDMLDSEHAFGVWGANT